MSAPILAWLRKDQQGRLRLFSDRRPHAGWTTAWRLVDENGQDKVQPWCASKSEARITAWRLRYILIEDDMTAEQFWALVRWRDRQGRKWRDNLHWAWVNGKYQGSADAALLQQIRYTHGPAWLITFRFPEHTPKGVKP